MQKTSFGLVRSGYRKKETATGPMRKQGQFRKHITCSHAMLTFFVNSNNLRTKYNLHSFAIVRFNQRDLLQCQNQNKSGCYLLFRWYFPVKIIMLVILPKRVICDCESSTTPAVTDRHTLSSNIVFIRAVPCQGCQGTTRVKLIITRLTAIADFKQRCRQRGKTVDCSFK